MKEKNKKTMANFYISITDDGNQIYTPSVIRNGVAPSGGTAKTIANFENIDGNYGIKTKQLGAAIQAAMRAILDDVSVNGV